MSKITRNKPLTEKQQAYRKRLLAQVHLSKKYVEFYSQYDDDYRAMLQQHFNVDSAAKLSIDELQALVRFLSGRAIAPTVFASGAQLRYLRQKWQEKAKNPSEHALRQLCQKLFGIVPLRLDSLSKQQVSGLINAVSRM